jgi:hypothetical protein
MLDALGFMLGYEAISLRIALEDNCEALLKEMQQYP